MKFGQWLGLFCLIISFYVLWEIRQLLLLVFTAVVFAIALNRITRYLQRFGIKRHFAIAITLLATLIVISLFFILVVPPFIAQFQNLIALLPKVWDRLRTELLLLEKQQFQINWLPQLPTVSDLIDQLQPLGSALFKNFFALFSNSFALIFQLLLVIVLTLMMLVNPQGYRKAFLMLFPSFYRRRADEILTASEEALGNWLTGIVITSTFIGTLSGIGLLLLGIKLVLVHALLAGLLNLIPNLGPALSVIFPITIALLDSPVKIWAILALYFVIQQIESYFLTPTIMAKQVSLLPAVTLLAQIFFAQSFGFLGLLLALPLTVVAKTWLYAVLFEDVLDRWEISQDSDVFFAEPSSEIISETFENNPHDPENSPMDS
ncbi:AI-2E family transporter [Candidatus Gracilibacteria bacterium]|nr:AI-2E family transporter [Candidatus Gracilibacteria bacterium]